MIYKAGETEIWSSIMVCHAFVILATLLTTGHAFSMGMVASYAQGILYQSRVPGQNIRLCTCREQRQCAAEMEQQVTRCADSCISYFGSVTANPSLLIPCYRRLLPQAHAIGDCVQNTLQSCSAVPTNQVVPYTSITQILNLAEAQAYEMKNEIMSQRFINRIRPVAEAAFSFAGCVKQCFINMNRSGYCFDRVQCQPSIDVNQLSSSMKRCSRGFNWKREAGSLCVCAQSAGVVGLQSVCPLLSVMGK